jgi:omega-6 fatty acid desaturase (delta-12 desaturase)
MNKIMRVESNDAGCMGDYEEVMRAKKRYEDFSRMVIRSEYFRTLAEHNDAYRHLIRFFLNVSIFSLFILCQYKLWYFNESIAIAFYPAYLFIQGLIVSGFIIHCHEFTHRHIKTPWLNDFIGVATGGVAFVNFYSFQQAHQLHHANIGNLDAPEAGAPVSPKGQKKIRKRDRTRKLAKKVADKWPFIWLFIAWPLFVYDGDYNSWLLPFKHRRKIEVKSLVIFILIMILNLTLIILFPTFYLFLYLPVVFLGGNRFIVITYLHHAHHGSVFFNEEHHNFYNIIMANTDRDFGLVINFFMMNNGFHVAHHLNPQIAYYNLPNASRYLRSVFPPDLIYPYIASDSLYGALKKGRYNQRITQDCEFFQLKLNSWEKSRAIVSI